MATKVFTVDAYNAAIARALGQEFKHATSNRIYIGGLFTSKTAFAKAIAARPFGHSEYSAAKDVASPRDAGQFPEAGALYVRSAARDSEWVRLADLDVDQSKFGENL